MSARKATKYEDFQQTGSPENIFSDFDTAFLPHPFTKQISRSKGVDSVKMALRNLILTNKYERLRNPNFGGNIRQFLFEPFSPAVITNIKTQIEYLVSNYEPRVRLIDTKITSDEDNNAINIRIIFSINLSQENEEVELTLYRVR